MEAQKINIAGAASKNGAAPSATDDIMSGSLIKTENIVNNEYKERIKNFIWEKFDVEDIRELEMRPLEGESDDDEDDD